MRVFLLQRLSAIALLFFLTLHMIVVHYPPFHIDFSIILKRMTNPLWKGVEIAFLFTVLVHAVTGMYSILLDYERVAKYKRVLAWVGIGLGIIGFIWGTITVLSWTAPV